MKVQSCALSHRDHRGTITDIVQGIDFQHATIITSRAGARRGDHYHKESTQYVYVVSGVLQALAQMPGGELQAGVVRAGDLVVNEPLEHHALVAISDATFLVLTNGPRGGDQYESDTFRLDKRLGA